MYHPRAARAQGYKAFYLAIGLQKAVRLNVEGEELDGVIGGIDFLRGVNRGETTSVSGDTVVIGRRQRCDRRWPRGDQARNRQGQPFLP